MSRLDRSLEFSDTVFTRDTRAWWASMDVPGVNVCTAERLGVDEAFRRYLPWEVEKVRLIDGQSFDATDYYGLKRPDTGDILGVAKDGYRVIRNAEVADLLAAAVEGTDHAVASIGALARGAITFVSLDFDGVDVPVAGGQALYPYLAVVNGNDGSASLKPYATAIRPECLNTIDAGWLGGHRFRAIRHTASAGERLELLRSELRAYLGLPPLVERAVRRLIDTRVDALSYRRALEALTPVVAPLVKDGKVTNARAVTLSEKRRDEVIDLAYNDERVGYAGTLWGAFQTLSTYDQQVKSFRKTKASGVTARQQVTLTKLFSGEQTTADANRLDALLRVLPDITDVKVRKGELVLA